MHFWRILAVLTVVGTLPARASSYGELNAGFLLFNDQKCAEAVTHFDAVIAAHDLIPSLVDIAYLDRGLCHESLGHAQLAVADLSTYLARKPGDPDGLENRAFAYADLNDADHALADITALRNIRKKAELRGVLGIVQWQLGRYSDADANFAAILKDNPRDSYSWLWLQLARVKQNLPLSGDSTFLISTRYWPWAVVSFFQGQMTVTQLMDAARGEEGEIGQKQVCEANFYAGEWRILHGDTGGKALIHDAADNCPPGYTAGRMARSELAKSQ